MQTPFIAITTADAQPYWDGLQSGRLLLQRCAGCGTFRHYPRPMCPACHAMEVDWVEVDGQGTVHSWTVPHRSALPAFAAVQPFTLLTVDLPQGVRLLGMLRGSDQGLAIGAAVRMAIEAVPGGALQPVFTLA
jgi:uncharacterized OB-fold protein